MSEKMQQTMGATGLTVAVLATGLLAGFYYAYACSVMIALGKFDDKTFVDVMNKINVVVVNPVFMLSFLGSIVFSIAAGACYLRSDLRPVLIWIAVGLALNVASFAITGGFNIPLNNQLATADNAQGTVDFAALREQFEVPWVRWNIARGLANTGALAALASALIQHGRLTR